MENTSGILVYIEHKEDTILDLSIELLGKAKELADEKGEKVYAVAIGSNLEFLEKDLQGYGVESLYLYNVEGVFNAHVFEKPFCDCIALVKPSVVLMGGTTEGRALAARTTVYFKTGITADCTLLEWDNNVSGNGSLIQTRPAFGGNIMASIVTENTRPQIATVRAKMFPKPIKTTDNTTKIIHNNNFRNIESGVSEVVIEEIKNKIDITKYDILIVAGRGVKKKEDLLLLERLANLLGGTLASSRALVEKEWTTPSQQIGLSGNSVSPKCMITFGVSGSVQFQSGMKSTPNIIAINSDPNAKIFEIAHYPICADMYEVIHGLLEKFDI